MSLLTTTAATMPKLKTTMRVHQSRSYWWSTSNIFSITVLYLTTVNTVCIIYQAGRQAGSSRATTDTKQLSMCWWTCTKLIISKLSITWIDNTAWSSQISLQLDQSATATGVIGTNGNIVLRGRPTCQCTCPCSSWLSSARFSAHHHLESVWSVPSLSVELLTSTQSMLILT